MKFICFVIIAIFFWTGCNSGRFDDSGYRQRHIAVFDEASGICYASQDDTLYAVGDNGYIYHYDKSGHLLDWHDFSDHPAHDFEGISCHNEAGMLYVAVEGIDNLLVIDRQYRIVREINIDRKDENGEKILVKDPEYGIEGVTTTEDRLYVVNQSYNQYPDSDPSALIALTDRGKHAVITEFMPMEREDLAGLSYHDGILYILSDSEKKILRYDPVNESILSEVSVDDIDSDLKDLAVEGIAFDNEGNLFLTVDDKDDQSGIYRYPDPFR